MASTVPVGQLHALTVVHACRAWSRPGAHAFLRPVKTLKHHTEAVNCVEVLQLGGPAGGALLASGSSDRTVSYEQQG